MRSRSNQSTYPEPTTQVRLSPDEQRIARYLAKRRYEQNRAAGVEMPWVGVEYDEDKEVNGMAAEIAFCRLMNLYPDLTARLQHDTADCRTSTGMKVDVKQTTHQNGRLIVPIRKQQPTADVYVLMVGDFPCYEYRGWCLAELLIRPSMIDRSLPRPAYAVSQSELSRGLLP